MSLDSDQLRTDAFAIWMAAVDAVRADRLVRDQLAVVGDGLRIGDDRLPLADLDRIVIVGAGKAGAGMARGALAALGDDLARAKQLTGWLNVPADCVQELPFITLHPARPAGLNEPTDAGVDGARRILELVENLGPRDLCLCLISGGGSALLPAPADRITLADKQQVTKHLSASGANIRELNTVRKQLSRIKGGGLARACRAGRLATLIISDVLGDPLDVIASGPTVPDSATARDALEVLARFRAADAGVRPAVFATLEAKLEAKLDAAGSAPDSVSASASTAAETLDPLDWRNRHGCRITNRVIGNNAVAVAAAAMEARRRGYITETNAAVQLEGDAEELGRGLAAAAIEMQRGAGPEALITGGEPVVRLAPAGRRGKGGRNQQLVLAALDEFNVRRQSLAGAIVLSGGTDGEDGPTDAAGAWIDTRSADAARWKDLAPPDYLARNDAYTFFAELDTLIRTGPTHTNVCDVRVVLVAPRDSQPFTS